MMDSFFSIRRIRIVTALFVSLANCAPVFAESGHEALKQEQKVIPGVVWMTPFLMILGAIALFPLYHKTAHAWEKNRFKLALSIVLGGVVLAYYGTRPVGFHGSGTGAHAVQAVLEHVLIEDYIPFVVLLFGLYVAAGGLRFEADLIASPTNNTIILGIGALLASLIGTTGASMLMIRPLLQTNSERTKVSHTVVFFIFLVSNIGGLLTPIGDPPLFLGYLQGVPFTWTLRLFPYWIGCVSALLAIYWVWDWSVYRTEPYRALIADRTIVLEPKIRGQINFLILGLMVLSVILLVPGSNLFGWSVPDHSREVALLSLAALSLAATPRGVRAANEFNYHAILEVACLFLGIFITMQVPMEYLSAKGPSLGLSQPVEFFWASGILSSFLDNAPTYLVFLETAKSLPTPLGMSDISLISGAVAEPLLAAISLGAVFMGANTYIGNGPNFMVKSIAEQAGVKMPSFFGYMVYSFGVLIPLFVLISLLGL
jgi:Na+/H+ antiporter NhaD/arsenite permease-like protein